jgi:hypothetical protein
LDTIYEFRHVSRASGDLGTGFHPEKFNQTKRFGARLHGWEAALRSWRMKKGFPRPGKPVVPRNSDVGAVSQLSNGWDFAEKSAILNEVESTRVG